MVRKINKGNSDPQIQRLELALPKHVFTHGELYIAFPRVAIKGWT